MKMLHGGADGSTKDIISTDYELSSRSYAYVAADSSVYLYGRGTRSDGYSPAWNGFFGQIQGWSVGEKDYTGQLYYPYGTDSPEWKYFGSVPYDLGPTAIPIADDGSTFLVVPDRSTLHRAQTPQGFDLPGRPARAGNLPVASKKVPIFCSVRFFSVFLHRDY